MGDHVRANLILDAVREERGGASSATRSAAFTRAWNEAACQASMVMWTLVDRQRAVVGESSDVQLDRRTGRTPPLRPIDSPTR